ncbi:PREDICTED: uncharacterized protein LOC105547903 [Mandrillus leucophaeus]|uniref:uncharacterized protein LOC105547903 n=1 Tax=Mandrillus leucophaeus TaxID=9568 RepID=UPI0005F54F88|nr:PREDICTED: uncharacterized protein LOC105547903 [Mandrillus leucophaeus]
MRFSILTHSCSPSDPGPSHCRLCSCVSGLLHHTVPAHHSIHHQVAFSLVSLTRKIKTFATKMVITSGNDEDRGGQEKESKEESVLAMLGIIGTILNLIVIIFVYIYTTL